MPITEHELASVRRVRLPALEINQTLHSYLLIRHIASAETECPATATSLRTYAGKVKRIQLRLGDGRLVNIVNRRERDLFADAEYELSASDFRVEDNTLLTSTKFAWDRHPLFPPNDIPAYQETIRVSWKNALTLSEEQADAAGNVVAPGLRSPQIGALHSLAAHWTVEGGSALVVMPTGTGKTEVMLASMIMQQPKRMLVLVPSDPLREQTFAKFLTLGILPNTPVLSSGAKTPLVGLLRHAPPTVESLVALRSCNVVVSTVAMLGTMAPQLITQFLKEFDVIYFDEAHHLPANSWNSIHEKLPTQRVVQFTATPFRRDGHRIPGRIIYNFPLRLAQKQNYFRPIKFIEVNEIDPDIADREIAARAVDQLRQDLRAGLAHIILARAETRERANKLFVEIYQANHADLNPVVIYTGLSGKKNKLRAIREGRHQIVICVDMFGEGFDLPALKIAAMHDLHGSLAITLQFTGRFTRSGRNIGNATLVANVGDVKVSEAIEDLYAEDADWNKLIPALSSKAIQSQIDFADFMAGMSEDAKAGEGSFDLNILKPKTSTVIYRTTSFNHRHFRKGVKRGTTIEHHWTSRDHKLVVFITKTKPPIDWAMIKETSDEIWDLFIAFHDAQRGLLFIHSSQKGTLYGDLAKAVGGDQAQLISGENIFRAFHGVHRLVFHNVGLYGRGKLRFRMYTGLDVTDAISPATQAGSTKSNVFAVGYEEGSRVSIGASSKGRVWSMSSSSIPDWQVWCKSVADKITNEAIRNNDFLQHTLVPVEVSVLPAVEIFAVLLPDEWFRVCEESSRITAGGTEIPLLSFTITEWAKSNHQTVKFRTVWGTQDHSEFEMRWGVTGTEVGISQVSGPELLLQFDGRVTVLAGFFRENPPVLFLMDGSEIKGSSHFERHDAQAFTFDVRQIQTVDWGDVPITLESKWKHGIERPTSVQGHFISMRTTLNNSFVIDDDDAGESADIVEISETGTDLLIRLFHCKYSGGESPGARVKDLYEVCGQAVRSARLVERPVTLLRHLEKRESLQQRGGRPTRFEKGSLKELRALRRRLSHRRSRFEIAVVQPGISVGQLTPELSSILGAADSYVREFTGRPLAVYGSA